MMKSEDDLDILKHGIVKLCSEINDVKFLRQIYTLLVRHIQRKKGED